MLACSWFGALAFIVPVDALATADTKAVVALMPPSATTPELVKLGLLMEARASELLEAAGKTSEIHLRQVLEMAREESLPWETLNQPATSELARQVLGADLVVTTMLRTTSTGLMLEGVVVEAGKRRPFSATLPRAWPRALVAGSEAIAKALVGSLPKTRVQPESTSEPALVALADCWAISVQQPLGVEEPVVINEHELGRAIAACRRAVTLDPSLHFALATMALMQAIAGDDQGATASLMRLDGGDDMVEAATLARFWLLTRYQSNEAGLAFLRDAAAKHPAELILLATLAADYASLHDDANAVKAWKALLAAMPKSSSALGHLSEVVARTGRREEALSHAQRALDLAPSSRGARLHVGRRLLDLGRAEDAIGALISLEASPGGRAEHLLTLGKAHLMKGDLSRAASLSQSAVAHAARPEDWRTRGRAYLQLALIEARRGERKAAAAALRSASETGLRVRSLDPVINEVLADGGSDFAPLRTTPAPLVPRESSLFPLNAWGEPEPSRPKPPPPEGLILFRF